MQGDRSYRHSVRHRAKRQLVGHQIPPAWRQNAVQATQRAVEHPGSKIFLSRLPVDVNEQEVEELFKKTVGPVQEVFLVYNSQGKSKGMAVVSFVRASDAAQARAKYNGKIVDGRRPIKIEFITDAAASFLTPHSAQTTPPVTPSLLDRLGVKSPPSGPRASPAGPSLMQRTQIQRPPSGPNQPLVAKLQAQAAAAMVNRSGSTATPIAPPHRLRVKKGPKRLKKQAVSAEDLDKQMDDYRASFPETDFSMT